MVRQGDFGLGLVDATTRQPLKEYPKNGEVWVVGKPGTEFFLQLSSWHTTSTAARPITVDGKSIGRSQNFKPSGNGVTVSTVGARQGVSGSHTAFKFAAIPPTDADNAALGECGTITATWTAAVATNKNKNMANKSGHGMWAGPAGATVTEGKKEAVGALKSAVGSVTMVRDSNPNKVQKKWKSSGGPLSMITIRYCEEAGLVARKIINPSDIKKRAGEPLTAGKGKQKMAKKTAAAAVNMPDSDAAGPADTAPALRRATPPDASWPHDQVAAWLRFRNVGAKALSTLVGLDGEELMALTKGDFIDAGVPQGKAVAVFRLLHPPGSAGQPISIE